jgi:hypothetical protein
VQNGRAYVTRSTDAVDAQELEKFSPEAAAKMNCKRSNSVFQKVARRLLPNVYERVIGGAKSSEYTAKLDEYPIAISTSEGTRCYTVIDGQSYVVSPTALRRAEFNGINPKNKATDIVTDIITYASAPVALMSAIRAGMAASNGNIESLIQQLGFTAFPLGAIAAGRLTKKQMTQNYKEIAKEPPHYD